MRLIELVSLINFIIYFLLIGFGQKMGGKTDKFLQTLQIETNEKKKQFVQNDNTVIVIIVRHVQTWNIDSNFAIHWVGENRYRFISFVENLSLDYLSVTHTHSKWFATSKVVVKNFCRQQFHWKKKSTHWAL